MSDEDAESVRRKAVAAELRDRLERESETARELEDAVAFLRAGGALDWDRWRGLGPVSKRVLGLAAEVVAKDRAARLAAAIVAQLPRPAPVDEAKILREAGRLALAEAAGRIA